MNLGFKDRFVPRVRSGEKRHTVRAGERWRVGMTGHLWENMRGRKDGPRPQTLIFLAPIIKVESFHSERSPRVNGHGSEGAFFRIRIDGHLLDKDELEAFARADGFKDSQDMHLWLNGEKRPLTLTGQVIYWDYAHRQGPRSDRVRKIIAYMSEHPLATYKECASKYGCTSARVQQIVKKYTGGTGRERQFARSQQRLASKHPPRGHRFVRMIRGWLQLIEHAYCACCHLAVPKEGMSMNGHQNPTRCKHCHAGRQRSYRVAAWRLRVQPQTKPAPKPAPLTPAQWDFINAVILPLLEDKYLRLQAAKRSE